MLNVLKVHGQEINIQALAAVCMLAEEEVCTRDRAEVPIQALAVACTRALAEVFMQGLVVACIWALAAAFIEGQVGAFTKGQAEDFMKGSAGVYIRAPAAECTQEATDKISTVLIYRLGTYLLGILKVLDIRLRQTKSDQKCDENQDWAGDPAPRGCVVPGPHILC